MFAESSVQTFFSEAAARPWGGSRYGGGIAREIWPGSSVACALRGLAGLDGARRIRDTRWPTTARWGRRFGGRIPGTLLLTATATLPGMADSGSAGHLERCELRELELSRRGALSILLSIGSSCCGDPARSGGGAWLGFRQAACTLPGPNRGRRQIGFAILAPDGYSGGRAGDGRLPMLVRHVRSAVAEALGFTFLGLRRAHTASRVAAVCFAISCWLLSTPWSACSAFRWALC